MTWQLWIAFKFSIFDRLITVCSCLLYISSCVVNCFQIFYLWQTDNSLTWKNGRTSPLWIAFKFSIFDRLITVMIKWQQLNALLWIAFKFSIFDRLITVPPRSCHPSGVLWIAFKFSIFDRLITVSITFCFLIALLWIAFKFSIFDRLITVSGNIIVYPAPLWIAFKFSIFDRLITVHYPAASSWGGCELLSNFLSLTDW